MTDSGKPTADRKAIIWVLAESYMRAAALPHIPVETPVNMCPDGDPPGERPMEQGWAVDVNAVANLMADALFASGVIQPANLHAAKVLREAADAAGEGPKQASTVAPWLRARADRIEEEAPVPT